MIHDERRAARFERRAGGFRKRSGKSRVFTGCFLLVVGAILLLQKISQPFPQWLFTWPVMLIALGAFIGIRKKFRGPGWLTMILIGALFLAADLYPEWNLQAYTWPILLIITGLAFMLRPRCNSFDQRWKQGGDEETDEKKNPGSYHNSKDAFPDSDELLDVVSAFGSTKKIILSKNFKGGEVTSFLGGTELNLSQADINGKVILDLTQVMGGTKLIVPPHWDIRPELVSVFGGIEDKRQLTATVDPTKILILKGTSVFGGIEIRSY